MEQRRLEIVRELRSWIGTPCQHQGRTKGVACDCIGLAVAAAEAAGRCTEDIPRNYGRLPHRDSLRQYIEAKLRRIAPEEAKIADIVLIAWRTVPMHVGILTPWRHEGETAPFGLLHAMIEVRGVAEHRFDPVRHNVVGYYRLPELA
jgi:hypothetical protein